MATTPLARQKRGARGKNIGRLSFGCVGATFNKRRFNGMRAAPCFALACRVMLVLKTARKGFARRPGFTAFYCRLTPGLGTHRIGVSCVPEMEVFGHCKIVCFP
jgi:hypothetical protein